MKNNGLEEALGDSFQDKPLAHKDEPCFVLVGRDALAAETVRKWADLAEANGVPHHKVAGARRIADEMEAYPHQKLPD